MRAAAFASLAALLGFAVATVVEDFLNPRLDPATHQISEYVKTPTGWVRTTGFALWAVSLVLLGWAAVTRQRGGGRDWVLRLLLLVAAAGVVILAVFQTQTSAGRLPPGDHLTPAGGLHDLGSGATSLALFLAAGCAAWMPALPRWLRRASGAIAALAVVCDVTLLLAGPGVGGIRQRVLVALGCMWSAALAGAFMGHSES